MLDINKLEPGKPYTVFFNEKEEGQTVRLMLKYIEASKEGLLFSKPGGGIESRDYIIEPREQQLWFEGWNIPLKAYNEFFHNQWQETHPAEISITGESQNEAHDYIERRCISQPSFAFLNSIVFYPMSYALSDKKIEGVALFPINPDAIRQPYKKEQEEEQTLTGAQAIDVAKIAVTMHTNIAEELYNNKAGRQGRDFILELITTWALEFYEHYNPTWADDVEIKADVILSNRFKKELALISRDKIKSWEEAVTDFGYYKMETGGWFL